MNTELKNIQQQYNVIDVVDLSFWTDDYAYSRDKCKKIISALHKDCYNNNERIVFLHNSDYYDNDRAGVKLQTLQELLNEIDISNFFVIVLSTNAALDQELEQIYSKNIDPVKITGIVVDGVFSKHQINPVVPYSYSSSDPIKIGISELTDRERFLLTESKTFCMYPWIHIHAYPTGEAYPCCHAKMNEGKIGNCREQTLEQIWNNPRQRQLRLDMLSETPNAACGRCYEQERSGFFSGRQSANKHHGHHIREIYTTDSTGANDNMALTYWDIRFSNLCNLRCRSCGHIFSSQWYQDQTKLAGAEWAKNNKVLNYAGRTETDIWEQLIPHLDYVEQIYFAGGEPLLMEEHYNILEELLRRGRTDVRLIYNTNFTHTDLKGRSVFEYWKQFKSVAVGASLDDMGLRAEYIRKGTQWGQVEKNREDMLAICPEVDFYISPTLSILNARHLPKFHRVWVEKGFIKPQDLNVNILQDPAYYRIDIATPEYKAELSTIYLNHIQWLRDQDRLGRATQGFEAAIAFMNATDNRNLIPRFWEKTDQLDAIRNENCLNVIPELAALR